MKITLFVCGNKDCARAFGRVTERPLEKWLRRQADREGWPAHFEFIETECWDRCDDAGCLAMMAGGRSVVLERLASARDRDRIMEGVRQLLAPRGNHPSPTE